MDFIDIASKLERERSESDDKICRKLIGSLGRDRMAGVACSDRTFYYDFMRVELKTNQTYCHVICTRGITGQESEKISELEKLRKEYWYRATNSCGALRSGYMNRYYDYEYQIYDIRDCLRIVASFTHKEFSRGKLLGQLMAARERFLSSYINGWLG